MLGRFSTRALSLGRDSESGSALRNLPFVITEALLSFQAQFPYQRCTDLVLYAPHIRATKLAKPETL